MFEDMDASVGIVAGFLVALGVLLIVLAYLEPPHDRAERRRSSFRPARLASARSAVSRFLRAALTRIRAAGSSAQRR